MDTGVGQLLSQALQRRQDFVTFVLAAMAGLIASGFGLSTAVLFGALLMLAAPQPAASQPAASGLIGPGGEANPMLAQPELLAAGGSVAPQPVAVQKPAVVQKLAQVQCTICFESFDTCVNLPVCGHQFCQECLENTWKVAVAESAPGKLVCPDTTCKSNLADPKFMPVFKKILKPADYTALHEMLNGQLFKQAFFSCPRCETKAFWDDGADLEHGRQVVCRSCEHNFCTKCCADRYHYNLPLADKTCSVVMREKEAAWLVFKAEGIQKVRAEQEDFAKQEEAFEDNQAKIRALELFKADEEAKRGWKLCPHCKTPWEGSDACSHVTCGVLEGAMGFQTATVGCGTEFDLDDAEDYVPVVPPSVEKLLNPTQGEPARHNIPCSSCNKEICGIRFRCLHCPSFNLCFACLQDKGQGHEAEKAWPEKDHVFDVIQEPPIAAEDRLAGLDLDDYDEDLAIEQALAQSLAACSAASAPAPARPAHPARQSQPAAATADVAARNGGLTDDEALEQALAASLG